MAESFLVRLQSVAGDIYLATKIDTAAHPEHPIVIPPDKPPVSPGVPTHPIALPGDPWWGADLHPEHPIVIPPEGETPPVDPPGTAGKNCKWGYTDEGWVLVCKAGPFPGGKPRPPG